MWNIDNEERKGGESDGIALPNKATMKGLKEGDSYKYLEVIHADGTLCYRVLWMSEKDTRSEIEWWKYNIRNK